MGLRRYAPKLPGALFSVAVGIVLRVMTAVGLTDLLGPGHTFYEVEDGLQAALRHRRAVLAGVLLQAEDFGISDVLD